MSLGVGDGGRRPALAGPFTLDLGGNQGEGGPVSAAAVRVAAGCRRRAGQTR